MPERDGTIQSREICNSGTPARVIEDGSISQAKLADDAGIPGSKLANPLVIDVLRVNTVANQAGTVSVAANVGTLLDGGYQTSTTTPGTGTTDLITVTVTLDYPGQPVKVFADGGMSTTKQDENERYQGFIEIDGAAGETMYIGAGNVTGNSSDVSGNTDTRGSHTHGGAVAADGDHLHASGTYTAAAQTISVSDTRTSLGCRFARTYTPTGSTVTIKLRGLRSGTLGSWQHDLKYQVFRNG